MTVSNHFFALRKDTTSLVASLPNSVGYSYSISTNCWSRSQVAKKSFNQLLYPNIR